ncbi:MAG TPA: hypothetical protein VF843_00950 [Streptosporangiaceae bacterium]
MARVEHASKGFERYRDSSKDHGHEDSRNDRHEDGREDGGKDR